MHFSIFLLFFTTFYHPLARIYSKTRDISTITELSLRQSQVHLDRGQLIVQE